MNPVYPKQGEREYFARIGPAGIAHSNGKPFSDEYCPIYLANMDALFHLLSAPPGRLVEFGCGVGWLTLCFALRGYRVTGVDISPDAIAAACAQRDSRQVAGAEFLIADYEEYVASEPFDYALFYDSLHHAEDERAAMRCAYRSLREGGMLIAFEPGRGHAQAPSSVHAVREWGVHEKDMPADHIVKIGREAGFRRHLVMPRPHEVSRILYRPAYSAATSQFDLFFRYWHSRLKVIRLMLGKRRPPFVMLWK